MTAKDERGDTDPWALLRGLPMGRGIRILRGDAILAEGSLVPSHELSGAGVVQVKLPNGYNVGVRLQAGDRVEDLQESVVPEEKPPVAAGPYPSAKGTDQSRWVALLTTGGTIASRVDYQTGGVRPVEEEAEILAFYPDLESDGPVRIRRIFDRLSENIAPTDWRTIAEEAVEAFTKGAVGVVIAHGTDTLGFTAAGLSFLLVDLPGPVVLVGAQRSPDRPSSDGASNLRAAVHVARHAELGEVVVVMHAGLSDDRFAIHRGTRVRKMHSSRRDAFQSRNSPPVGWLQEGSIHYSGPFRPPSGGPPRISGTTDGAAGILWTYPGLSPDRARASVRDLRGVVIAGTGLGHTATDHLPWIREATERGIIVVMTTQCLEGVVNPFVYATGRELLRAGVVYADDLLPETAFAKLVWALGQSSKPEEVCRLMLEDRAGEFEPRHRTEPGP